MNIYDAMTKLEKAENIRWLPIENFCDRKSFYGKCVAWYDEERKMAVLRSYNTIVCVFKEGDGFHRTWWGDTRTTIRHVNAFAKLLGFPKCGGVEWWRSLPYEPVSDFV